MFEGRPFQKRRKLSTETLSSACVGAYWRGCRGFLIAVRKSARLEQSGMTFSEMGKRAEVMQDQIREDKEEYNENFGSYSRELESLSRELT